MPQSLDRGASVAVVIFNPLIFRLDCIKDRLDKESLLKHNQPISIRPQSTITNSSFQTNNTDTIHNNRIMHNESHAVF